MGTFDPKKVIDIALAEEGYLEKSTSAYKADPSCLDHKTKGAGSDNYTKYGRDMHKLYPAIMDFPAAWCDAFVDWCFQKAYGVTNAKGLLGGDFNDYTVASAQLYKNKNALDTNPTYAAQAFFTKNGQVSGCYHTALVYNVDSTYFYTVEGNTSGGSGVIANGGGVSKKKYSIAAYKGRVLFGHPNYGMKASSTTTTSSSNTSTAKPSTTTKVDAAKSYDKTLAATYKVNTTSDPLTLRSGAGTNKTALASIPKGTKINCYGYYTEVDKVKWLYIEYNKVTGFVSSKYLKKV